jgi:hypothetical protein
LNGTSGETVRSGRFPSSWQTTIRHGLREPATGRYRVDVFREPHVGDPRMGRQSGGVNATVYVIVVGWATLPALSLALTMPQRQAAQLMTGRGERPFRSGSTAGPVNGAQLVEWRM